MHLYSILSPSHAVFRDHWFLPSMVDDFKITIHELPQNGDGTIGNQDFNRFMRCKVDLILRAVEENWGGRFIYSDVDVQFLGPAGAAIEKSLQDCDIAFQRETPTGHLCAGFFAARANEATRQLWQTIADILDRTEGIHDQDALNDLLAPQKCPWSARTLISRGLFQAARQFRLIFRAPRLLMPVERYFRMRLINHGDLRVAHLPVTFFGGGTLSGRMWKPGDEMPIPPNPVMHHANYTSYATKIAQMQYVRDKVNLQKS